MNKRLLSISLTTFLFACGGDSGSPSYINAPPTTPANGNTTGGGNTNVALGGAQDLGFFRGQIEQGIVPRSGDLDSAGFFAEHHTPLPEPSCGERICLQAMLGVMSNLNNGNDCTMLQLGLNSPITVNPEDRPPLTLAIVIDVSGSMNNDRKIDFVREGLAKMVNELSDEDQIALITYETRVETIFEMSTVRGQRNRLAELIQGLWGDGSTNLYGGLEQGYKSVLENYDSSRQNRVILLSDGQPTAGHTDIQTILAMSRGYNTDGIGLTSVGLGTNFNIELMRSLAEQGDGNFYFVENTAAIDEVFTEELAYFTVPVALDLELELVAGPQYRFVQSYGSSAFETTQDGGALQVPSVFLAHRTSHNDVTEDDGRRGGGSALLIELMPGEDDGTMPSESTVATVDVSFTDPNTLERVTDQVTVQYPGAPWLTPAAGFFDNEIVEKSFVMLNIFGALQDSTEAFHNDAPREAVGILLRVIAAARDYEDSANEGEGDVDIQLDIELMEALVDVMERNGATPPDDPGINDDPWPRD